MNDSKRQTRFMIGIALLVVAGILMYISLSQPKVYNSDDSTEVSREIIVSSTSATDLSANSVSTSTDDVSVSFPVNLNTATYEELKAVNGIGEQRAYQIIAYRESVGNFKSVEEIKNIKGIGDATYQKIAPYLTV